MAKEADAPVHDGSNVIPFVRREEKVSHPPEEGVSVGEYEVDVLMCSLCGSSTFFLLSDMMGQIGCSSCGFLIGATWRSDTELPPAE